MGKGKAPTHTTQRVTQDVPAFLKPYYTDVMSKSKALSEETYNPFGGQRLVDDSADLGTSQQMIRGIAGNPLAEYGEAQGTLGGLGTLAGQLGQQAPSEFTATQVSPYAGFTETQVSPYAGFTETQVSPYAGFQEFGGAQEFGYDPTRQFDTATAAQYMDPFMQTVVGRQQDDAIEKFRQQHAGRDASAVHAGAFGGSRHAVQQASPKQPDGPAWRYSSHSSQRAFEQHTAV